MRCYRCTITSDSCRRKSCCDKRTPLPRHLLDRTQFQASYSCKSKLKGKMSHSSSRTECQRQSTSSPPGHNPKSVSPVFCSLYSTCKHRTATTILVTSDDALQGTCGELSLWSNHSPLLATRISSAEPTPSI